MKNKMYVMLLSFCMLFILQGCTVGNVNIITDSVTISSPEEPDPAREELDRFAALMQHVTTERLQGFLDDLAGTQ